MAIITQSGEVPPVPTPRMARLSGGRSTLAARSIFNTLISGTVRTAARPGCLLRRSLSACRRTTVEARYAAPSTIT